MIARGSGGKGISMPGYPYINRYTEVQAKQRLKQLMVYLISKGTLLKKEN